jgi:hypothetical protein
MKLQDPKRSHVARIPEPARCGGMQAGYSFQHPRSHDFSLDSTGSARTMTIWSIEVESMAMRRCTPGWTPGIDVAILVSTSETNS